MVTVTIRNESDSDWKEQGLCSGCGYNGGACSADIIGTSEDVAGKERWYFSAFGFSPECSYSSYNYWIASGSCASPGYCSFPSPPCGSPSGCAGKGNYYFTYHLWKCN